LKIFDSLLGRTTPAQPDLDRLFRLPSAALTLQSAFALRSTGQAGVAYKREAGRGFAETQEQIRQLLGLGDGPDESAVSVHEEQDAYGYSWIIITCDDFERLVNLVHVVNGTLGDEGYGAKLLLSAFAFDSRPEPAPAVATSPAVPDSLSIEEAASSGGFLDDTAPSGTWTSATPIYLVYLFKRGTFYPFVPTTAEKQDVPASFLLADTLDSDLVIEKDLEKRFPIWGVPVH
jgi:hypothetical protein